MTGTYLAIQLVNGLILGSMYALIAIGFSMIYGIVRLINFAHGDIAMLGAFTALAATVALGAPGPLVLLAVLAAGALVGVLVEAVAFRPIRAAPQVTGFIASLAVSILIQNLALMLLTAQPRRLALPEALRGVIRFGILPVRVLDLCIIAVTLVSIGLLTAFVRLSRTGIAMRATAESLETARLMGIDVDQVIRLCFAIGSAFAAVAGVAWGLKYGQIDPQMGVVPGLKAFVAAVIGGVGSIGGAAAGGLLLGLAEVLFVGLLPPDYSGYRNAFVFALLILVLLIAPNGLFGRSTEARA